MTKYKDPDSWRYRGVKRRDFRASKAGPEEMPHKKSGYGNINKSKCDHEWTEWHQNRDSHGLYSYKGYTITWHSLRKVRRCKVCHKKEREYKYWSTQTKQGSLPEQSNGPLC